MFVCSGFFALVEHLVGLLDNQVEERWTSWRREAMVILGDIADRELKPCLAALAIVDKCACFL